MIPKIQFERVSKTFTVKDRGKPGSKLTRFTALEDISFEVNTGEFLVIVGPSGAGSRRARPAGGLTTPCSGRILLDASRIGRSRDGRGIVFQQYALPWRTALVKRQVRARVKAFLPKNAGRSRAATFLGRASGRLRASPPARALGE